MAAAGAAAGAVVLAGVGAGDGAADGSGLELTAAGVGFGLELAVLGAADADAAGAGTGLVLVVGGAALGVGGTAGVVTTGAAPALGAFSLVELAGLTAVCAEAEGEGQPRAATRVANGSKRRLCAVIVVSYCNSLGLPDCDKVVVDPIGESVVARRRFYGFSAK